jgi:hypothetical protein
MLTPTADTLLDDIVVIVRLAGARRSNQTFWNTISGAVIFSGLAIDFQRIPPCRR